MQKPLIITGAIIIVIVVGALFYFQTPTPPTPTPPPYVKETPPTPSEKISFDTNDNLDPALQDLDQIN